MFMLKMFAKVFSINHKSVRLFSLAAMLGLFFFWFINILECDYLKVDLNLREINYPSRLVQEGAAVSEAVIERDEDANRLAAFKVCISNILQQCCYLVILWFWIYAAKKYYRGATKQKGYLEDILGKSDMTEEIWRKHKSLSHAFPVFFELPEYREDEECEEDEDEREIPVKWRKPSEKSWKKHETKPVRYLKDTPWAIVIKVLYLCVWIVIMVLCDFFIIKLGYEPIVRSDGYPTDLLWNHWGINWLCAVTMLLLILTQFMSYHSWWICMEQAYFIRNISKKIVSADKPLHDIEREFKGNFLRNSPSETPSFRRLMHDSEMTSVAFLIVSSMFALACLIPYGIMGTEIVQTGQYDPRWMSFFVTCAAFVPGLVSLIPVSVLPKIFLYRILRKWKRISIKEIEAKINLLDHKYEMQVFRGEKEIEKYEKDRLYWEEQIYKISKNRFSLNVVGVAANVVTCVFYSYSIYSAIMAIMK